MLKKILPNCCSCAAALLLISTIAGAATPVRTDSLQPSAIQLDLHPRICTLAADDENCEAAVQAQWQAPRDESLCLVIVGRPEIKRCWENYSAGIYTVELVFNSDLVVELRDPQLQQVLASQTITVIREALQLRRKRRQPWNILF